MKRQNYILLFILSFLGIQPIIGQVTDSIPVQVADSIPAIDYANPVDYEIGGVTVRGNNYSDAIALKSIAGLKVGNKMRIPGPGISAGIKALWKLKLFTDVRIYATKAIGEIIFLEIAVQERPRLTTYSYVGAKKSRHTDLNEVVNQFLST